MNCGDASAKCAHDRSDYDWEVIDEDWKFCRKTSLWLSIPARWLYRYDSESDSLVPFRAYVKELNSPEGDDSPRPELTSFKTPFRVRVAATSMQGRRPTQEDRVLICADLKSALQTKSKYEAECPMLCIVVCDGHAGSQAADFVVEKLSRRFSKILIEDLSASESEESSTSSPSIPCKRRLQSDGECNPANEAESQCSIKSITKRVKADTNERLSDKGCTSEKAVSENGKEGNVESDCETNHVVNSKKSNFLTDSGRIPNQAKSSLEKAFSQVDDMFLNEYRTARDGCTATMACMLNEYLCVAGCGDTRAVLALMQPSQSDDNDCTVNNGNEQEKRSVSTGALGGRWTAIRMSIDHKPSLASERARIESRGGLVKYAGLCARVMSGDIKAAVDDQRRASYTGQGPKGRIPIALAVSRAFGDKPLKVNGVMTALPDVKCVKVDPKIHKALIVATDGLWDVVGDDQAVKIVSEFYPDDPQGAASSLTKSAFQLNSQDNITCTVTFFSTDSEKE